MTDLRELYQEVILDHNKRPRNFRVPEQANRKAEGYNPLCGDRITVYLHMNGDVIDDLGFQGTGCAISKASASMMTDELKGKTVEQANALFERFHNLVTAAADAPVDENIGKLAILSGKELDAGEVREPRMAHDEGSHGGGEPCRIHRVTTVPERRA